MKRKLLFLLGGAVFGGLFSLNVVAQTDVTSTYIADADFSSTSGWAQNHSSDYWTLGNGLIGTYAVANNKKSTTDDTHLATEYCLGIQCRWSGSYANFSQTTAELPAGFYTLTFDVENTNTSTTSATYNNLFTIKVGETTYTDTKKEWMSGSTGWTTHTIAFSVTEAAVATISLGYGTGSNNFGTGATPHLYVSHLKLSYTPFATGEDYENLNTAISTVEGKSWGFDNGEYAPYNYVEVLEALATAKAIDQTTNNPQPTVQSLISTLNGATWVANSEEVNAIFDGSFEHDYSAQTGNIQPLGWYRVKGTYSGDGTNVRYIGIPSGVSGNTSGHGFFGKFTMMYGDQPGYSLPLNGGYYTLKFSYGGYNEVGTREVKLYNDNNQVTISTITAKDNQAHVSGDSFTAFSEIVNVPASGDYVLSFYRSNTTNQNQIVITDIVLKTTTIAEATDYYNNLNTTLGADYEADVYGGTEKTAFKAALDASIPGSVAEIMTAATDLQTKHDTYVAAKLSYAKYYTERTRAIAMGVTEANIADLTIASDMQTVINGIIVQEDAAATDNYTMDGTEIFGSWTPQNTSTASGQHWSGDDRSYIDKNSGDGFTMSVTNTVTLPAGSYVFKSAARAADGGVWDDALTMQVTGQPNAIFNPRGNSGYGIDVDGKANYSDAGTYANNNNGRGWEWRFIPFTLTDETEITMKIEAIVKGGNWASFSDITLLTTADNIGVARSLYEKAKTAAEAARDNADYTNVTGAERTALTNAIGAGVTETVAWYQTQKGVLEDATSVFTSAKDSYDALVAAKGYAVLTKITANVGTGAFQYNTTNNDALFSAYETAKDNVDGYTVTSTSTAVVVQTLVDALDNAIADYEGQEINAPADGQLFHVILTYDGWTYDNKAMTYIANGRNDQGNYTITYAAEANTNLAQAFTFTKVAGNNYILSQIDADGNVRYLTDAKTAYNGNDPAYIRTTTEADKALEVEVIPTTTEGVWNLKNTVADNYIGSKDSGVFTINSHIDFNIVETTKPSIIVNTTAAGWGTLMLPFAVSTLPDGVKAYTCAEVENNELKLVEVNALEANKPYIIEGSWNETLTGDAQGTKLTYTEGLLTGVYADFSDFPANSYVMLKRPSEEVVFAKVSSSDLPTLKANRCYLVYAGGSSAPELRIGGATNIANVENSEADAVIYDLTGRRVEATAKGIYIVNGKKVFVK